MTLTQASQAQQLSPAWMDGLTEAEIAHGDFIMLVDRFNDACSSPLTERSIPELQTQLAAIGAAMTAAISAAVVRMM